MPRINTHGDVLSGLGLVWLTDTLIIGQRQQPDGSWAVCSAPSTQGPWTVVEPRGCNFIAAGGGTWAAFGGSIFGPAAVPGAAIPAGLDGRGAGSPDGTLLFVKSAESGGLILKRLDGTTFELPDAWPTDRSCVVDRDRALWVDARDGQVHTCGDLPVPLTLPGPVQWPSVFRAQNRWWIAYHSTDAIGYVCHPFDSFFGYPITQPPAFYPQGIALSDQVARFAWSADSSESDAARRQHDQSLTAPRVDLRPIVPPDPPVPPKPPKPPKPPGRPFPRSVTLRGTMNVYLLRDGKYCGVEPGTSIVYMDREHGGGWEEVTLTPRDGGLFDALFVAANVTLSWQPDGALQTRPSGTWGAYEQLRATSQPEGLDILYREADGAVIGEPLTIQER